MKFTKILIIAVMFLMLFSIESKSQNITSSLGYVQDSVVLAGSTSAGSRWFSVNAGSADALFLEIYNGTYWRTYEIDYPVKLMNSVRAYINGTDTTVKVQANMEGAYICLPLKVTAGTLVNDIDYGGALTITSPSLIRFKKVRK